MCMKKLPVHPFLRIVTLPNVDVRSDRQRRGLRVVHNPVAARITGFAKVFGALHPNLL